MRPPRLACLVSLPRLPCSPCPFPCLPRLLACPAACDSSLPCPRCPAPPSPPPSRPAPLALVAALPLMPPLSCPPDCLPVPVALRLLAAVAPLSSCGMSRGLATCARVRPPSVRLPRPVVLSSLLVGRLRPSPPPHVRTSPSLALSHPCSCSVPLAPMAVRPRLGSRLGGCGSGGGRAALFLHQIGERAIEGCYSWAVGNRRPRGHARAGWGAAAATARQVREWRR